MEGPEAYISSVSWVKEGNFLAVGTSEGAVEVSCFFFFFFFFFFFLYDSGSINPEPGMILLTEYLI